MHPFEACTLQQNPGGEIPAEIEDEGVEHG